MRDLRFMKRELIFESWYLNNLNLKFEAEAQNPPPLGP